VGLSFVARGKALPLGREGHGPAEPDPVACPKKTASLSAQSRPRGRQAETITIQETPKRSVSIPKRGEKKVLLSGIWT